MNAYTREELGYAKGMVERRTNLIARLNNAETQKQALMNHREVCGAVREVRKHHRNILQRIDNESAEHALRSGELVETVEAWLDMSRVVLNNWGVRDSDVQSLEGGLL